MMRFGKLVWVYFNPLICDCHMRSWHMYNICSVCISANRQLDTCRVSSVYLDYITSSIQWATLSQSFENQIKRALDTTRRSMTFGSMQHSNTTRIFKSVRVCVCTCLWKDYVSPPAVRGTQDQGQVARRRCNGQSDGRTEAVDGGIKHERENIKGEDTRVKESRSQAAGRTGYIRTSLLRQNQ